MFKGNEKPPVKTATGVETLIGRQTEIKGDVSFVGGLHVDGSVLGAVTARGTAGAHLSVSESGRIEGEVRVPTIVLNGTIQGDVFAAEKITLGAKARIVGNLVYKMLEMQSGAQVNGRLTHESNVKPAITHQPAGEVSAPTDQPLPSGGY
jgi:cytoskeletal protein CcmA (bactofilin family)